MEKVKKILSVAQNYEVILFDVYGVIWDGQKFYDGALETMETLVKQGKTVYLISNSQELSGPSKEAYLRHGLVPGVNYTECFTSGEMCHEYLKEMDVPKKFYNFGRPNPYMFEGTVASETKNMAEADFIYCGLPQVLDENGVWRDCTTLDPFKAELMDLVSLDIPLICANLDRKAFEGGLEQPVVRPGMIADLFCKLGGKVIAFGKPCLMFFDWIFRGQEDDNSLPLMIGDTIETDIWGAKRARIDTLLVRTGISANQAEEKNISLERLAAESFLEPDYIADGF